MPRILCLVLVVCASACCVRAQTHTDLQLQLPTPHGFVSERFEPRQDGLQVAETALSVYLPPVDLDGDPVHFTLNAVQTSFDGGQVADLPKDLYELSIDGDWRPGLTDTVSLVFGVTAGYHSDLDAERDAWLVGVRAFVSYRPHDSLQVIGGLVLSNRGDLPVLPVAGVVWSPTDTFRASVVYPGPRLTWRVDDAPTTQRWVYVEGQMAAALWAYETDDRQDDTLRYLEKRLVVGLQSKAHPGLYRGPRPVNWYIETGWSFDREIIVEEPRPDTNPNGAWVIAVGFMF